ncbi:hypothetical protein PILCRDRAFT_92803 [Piloderma croceum F 1598]|uniref:Uncharacterized protein n=1 Tax=Piloderma croceum (strain F 1598) TaxID=765440 RepID=A0A0C3EN00_PILCF|nr:hypothetical protein PILCRDRAFT_92803 [Piloderma croceum F 1598]
MDSTQLSSPSPTFIEDTCATARGTHKREEVISGEVVTSVPTVDDEVLTPDDFLYHLYDGARDVTVDDLVQFTQKSFESIENWCKAKSNSGDLAAVKKARVIGKDYVTAIKMSVKAAAHGITFIADILRLYECIQCHALTDTGALIKRSRVDAKVTYERFSTVRRTLFQAGTQCMISSGIVD